MLPYDAELSVPKNKKFQENIVFVHHHTGNKDTVHRHVKLVNDLGFTAISFTLNFPDYIKRFELPIASDLKVGLKYFWTDQIANILNHVSGDKIVFAFSNPCASAISAIRKRNVHDIRALICDGGPTSQVFFSTMSYLRESKRYGPLPMQIATAAFFSFLWSPKSVEDIHRDLDTLPDGFPILSIRGWRDEIVPPQYIDQIFSPHKHLDWRKLNLPEAKHLDGLKNFADEYKPQLQRFLMSISTPASETVVEKSP